jgi:hypothetical protein
MEKTIIGVIAAGVVTALLGFFAWQSITLIDVDKRTERTALKVDQNYHMIKPLWEQFIQSRKVVRVDDKSSNGPKTQ